MGHNAPCILFIVESSDWKAFGELQEKMQTDPELLAFWSKAHVDNPNRPAEIADIALALLIKDAFAADRYPFNQSRGECPMILLTKGGESSLLCLT